MKRWKLRGERSKVFFYELFFFVVEVKGKDKGWGGDSGRGGGRDGDRDKDWCGLRLITFPFASPSVIHCVFSFFVIPDHKVIKLIEPFVALPPTEPLFVFSQHAPTRFRLRSDTFDQFNFQIVSSTSFMKIIHDRQEWTHPLLRSLVAPFARTSLLGLLSSSIFTVTDICSHLIKTWLKPDHASSSTFVLSSFTSS